MKACTNPPHDWVDISFTSARGSTPVACTKCGEPGYRIDNQVLAQNLGRPEERLF